MAKMGWFIPGCLWVVIILTTPLLAEPPTCTVHFFDWYVVSKKRPLEQWQKRWTYRVDWRRFGIRPEEIGNTVHYYEAQFRKIREAGFDGIHYEWHGNNPKPQFIEALKKTGVPLAMFYDMQIRFRSRPRFITPTTELADKFVQDVCSFYASVPRELWLRDRNGKLPIVVYGYGFDTEQKDPEVWHEFYRKIIAETQSKLGAEIVLHWTDSNTPQQMYGYQHFPQIQSYIFNEAQKQSQVNAHSVTFVVHYDDLGVSFQRGGRRKRRWIRNDIRYLQEALWLAKHTDPALVFNYGWNELYEGEHILPDNLWGTWRYELAAAMVKEIKRTAKRDLPPALIIADDFLPAMREATPDMTVLLRQEMKLLYELRRFVPQADVALPGAVSDFSGYDFVIALNIHKSPREEKALADFKGCLIYANADAGLDTPLTVEFVSGKRESLPLASRLNRANEFVTVSREINLDVGKYPLLKYRCRNSAGSVFHIRYQGVDEEGNPVIAWYETSPTDDRATSGEWEEATVNAAALARKAAGKPVAKLTRIIVILDDCNENGEFTLDIDYLKFLNRNGEVGWQDEFEDVRSWSVQPNFAGEPDAAQRFGFEAVKENGKSIGRVGLKAVVSAKAELDSPIQKLTPRDDVLVLREAQGDMKAPLVLQHDDRFYLNTYCPSDETWETLMSSFLKQKLNRGVMFRSHSFSVTRQGVEPKTETAPMVIQEEELPSERIRLVAPPEFDKQMTFVLPRSSVPLRLRVISSDREEIPFPDSGSKPPTITLRPGEVVDLIKQR